LEVSPDGYIFLAAKYAGLYRSKKNYVTVKESINRSNIILNQNTPNPANETTEISYTLFKPTHIRFIVSDLLGNQKAEPINQWQEAGKHSVSISTKNYPPGIYFYRLETGGQVITRKMCVVR